MKYAILLPVLLLLGCSDKGFTDRQKNEIEDIAIDAAADAVAYDRRVDELRKRVEALEARSQ